MFWHSVAVATVRGVVTRWLDDHQPGFVEFVLTDVNEVAHVVHDKVPALTTESLCSSSAYPQELWIHAEVLSRDHDSVRVRLEAHVESVDGRTDFTLPLSSVRDDR